MTLTVNSAQLQLATRANVSAYPLIVLETFSDRDAETVDETYYWTRGAGLLYKWDGSNENNFLPLARRVSPIIRGFPHIPNSSVLSTRETVTITLDGSGRAGGFLWDDLVTGNVIGARVQIGSLLVSSEAHTLGPRWFDLSGLGAVHVIRWRGEVTGISELEGDEFSLTCESYESPSTFARRLLIADGLREDFGRVLPYVVGDATDVEGLRIQVGARTHLLADVTAVATTLTVFDAVGFLPQGPAQGILFRIDEEYIKADGLAETSPNVWTLSSLTRGQRGSTAAAHEAGSSVESHPLFLFYALSGSTCSDVQRATLVLDSGEAIAPSGMRIENNYQLDSRGPTALAVIFSMGATYEFPNYYGGNSARASYDVSGAYSVADSGTTLFNANTDAGNWGGTLCTVDNSSFLKMTFTSSVGIAYRDTDFSPARDATNREYRLTMYVPEATRVDLVFLRILIGDSGTSGSGFNAANATLTLTLMPWMIAADTDMDIRISGANHEPGADITGVLNIGVFCQFVNDDGSDRIVYIKGDVDEHVTTPLSAHPVDIAETVIEDLIENSGYTADATSFSTAKTNLPGVTINGDLVTRGASFAEILADLGHHARTNFFPAEASGGSVIKASNALSTYAFGTAVRTLATFDLRRLKSIPRRLQEIANRFTFLYDRSEGDSAALGSSYRAALEVDETNNPISSDVPTVDITDSQSDYGVRPAAAVSLPMLRSQASVIEVAAYYVKEALRGHALRFSVVVPWSEGYDLELGDIVEFTPPYRSTVVKCRVTRVAFDFDSNAVGLNLEEVS